MSDTNEKLTGYMCLVIDDDYHYYLIPIEYKQRFYQWLDQYYMDEGFDYDMFDDYRLNAPFSNVVFKDHYILGD